MGHFGRRPIQLTWLALIFPCLALNYLGQGALVLSDPRAAESPFFLLAPEALRLPLVLLATAATVIASQAVISGAYSLAQQAVQLGLLPRLTFRPTSEDHLGQIYAPQVNWLLMAGVTILVLAFGSSGAMAHAYGLSVVGAMITSSILAVAAVRRVRRRPRWVAVAALSPFILVEGIFLLANLMKLRHGGYVPLAIAAVVIFVMLTWIRGRAQLEAAEARDLDIADLMAILARRPPMRAHGTAVFLTTEPDKAPASLMHNLKHNQVLHEQVVLLRVSTVPRPRVPEAERVAVRDLGHGFKSVTLTYGFMETPDVARGLAQARVHGVAFDIMRTSFFVSRRTLIPRARQGLSRVQDLLFLFLARNAVRAADFFRLPPSRVVELGAQVTL
jgi:KUP system potassium uptake protein